MEEEQTKRPFFITLHRTQRTTLANSFSSNGHEQKKNFSPRLLFATCFFSVSITVLLARYVSNIFLRDAFTHTRTQTHVYTHTHAHTHTHTNKRVTYWIFIRTLLVEHVFKKQSNRLTTKNLESNKNFIARKKSNDTLYTRTYS